MLHSLQAQTAHLCKEVEPLSPLYEEWAECLRFTVTFKIQDTDDLMYLHYYESFLSLSGQLRFPGMAYSSRNVFVLVT